MNTPTLRPSDFDRPIPRAAVITLLNTALKVKEYRFARQTALAWLAAFPGDLGINLAHAQSLIGEGKFSQVAPIVEDLCKKDPEYLPAQRMRTIPDAFKDPTIRISAQANIHALTGQVKEGIKLPDWCMIAWDARVAFQAGDLSRTEQLVHQALVADPPSSLPAILHVQVARAAKDIQETRNLAELYGARWPDCIQFKLYQAEALMQTGDETASVALLHHCAAQDSAGQVPSRIWGTNHTYTSLWPSRLEIMFDLPVPAGVSGALGWNQLAGGPPPAPVAPLASKSKAAETPAPARQPLTPDVLRSITDEFERLAQRFRRPETSRSDGRFPVYVIFTAHHGLETVYGPQTAGVIESEMKNVVDAANKRSNWGSVLFIADDPLSTTPYGIKPAPSSDPWKLKLALHDLDAALAKKGEMIGALLIVGGPEVVPFHRLPNPTDDGDPDVPSDNPYASLDENYFIPDWPVGRLPGGSGPDSGMLLAALRRLVTYHKKQSSPSTLWNSSFIRNLLKHAKKILPRGSKTLPFQQSMGYSASVWKLSSQAVYKPIGDPQALSVCPPVGTGMLVNNHLFPAHLGYFNLHGVKDGTDWYGQRDANDSTSSQDYPVALTTKDILNSNQATSFVYSEACYGANIEQKTEDQSIALKFISSGCLAMVGSTNVAYGSVTTPLIGADLLGNFFWKNLTDGKTAGEALQQAKISLVSEMNKRQGYLDGEDQKTLISFVLFGDPLATIEEVGAKVKTAGRPKEHETVKVISDLKSDDGVFEPVPAEMLLQVKKVVDQYLPGLKDADYAVSKQQATFNEEGHPFPGSHMGKTMTVNQGSGRTVIRVCKQIEFGRQMHRHYARVTLDPKGKLIKLSVSR